jgi:hypothetical protein
VVPEDSLSRPTRDMGAAFLGIHTSIEPTVGASCACSGSLGLNDRTAFRLNGRGSVVKGGVSGTFTSQLAFPGAAFPLSDDITLNSLSSEI